MTTYAAAVESQDGTVRIEGSIAFNGATEPGGPQQDAITPVVTTTPTTSAYGYTQAQAEAIISQLNLVIAALAATGIIA